MSVTVSPPSEYSCGVLVCQRHRPALSPRRNGQMTSAHQGIAFDESGEGIMTRADTITRAGCPDLMFGLLSFESKLLVLLRLCRHGR